MLAFFNHIYYSTTMKKTIYFTILLSITTQLSALEGSVENQRDLCQARYEKVLSDLLAANAKSSCSPAEVEFKDKTDRTTVIVGGFERFSYGEEPDVITIQQCFHSESSSNFSLVWWQHLDQEIVS